MPQVDNNINVSYQQAQQLLQNQEAEFTPEQREKLLTIVNRTHDLWVAQGRPEKFNPQLSIPQPTNASDLGLLNDKWAGNSTTPIFDLATIMTLLHECAKSLKQANKEHRHASRDAEQHSLKAGADKLRKAADWTMASGCVSGGMQIAGGAASMTGAFRAGRQLGKGQAAQNMAPQMKAQRAQVKQTGKEVKAQQKQVDAQQKAINKEIKNTGGETGPQTKNVTEMKQQLSETQKKLETARNENKAAKQELGDQEAKFAEVTRPAQGKADRSSQKWQAAGQMCMGLGQVGSAPMDREAKLLEAGKVNDDAEAAIHRNLTQDADERVKDAQEYERNCREKLASIEEANNRAMSSANQV